MHIDLDALARALATLPSADGTGTSFGEALHAVIQAAAATIGASGSAIMFVDEGHVLRYVAATNEDGRLLELAQEEVGEGPCVDVLINDTTVTCRDASVDERWPQVAPLIAATSVKAVLGVPVHVAGAAIGSLNVYLDEPHDWEQASVDAVHAFNDVLENLVTTAVLARRHDVVVAQLQQALDHRVVIERAVGVLMGREGLDATTAFTRLRGRARQERRKVVELAAAVLDGDRR